jgi:SAM-dependent MidA family methyltransferase
MTTPAAVLKELCAAGPVTVEAYMAAALYDSEVGYYMRRAAVGGRRGDFATSATLHSVLGKAIARWAVANRPPGRGVWHLIEVGAGTGELAAAIFAGLSWWQRRNLRYHVVEISPVLRHGQQTRLAGYDVFWHPSVANALTAAANRAVVVSNELVDAFPCRQLVWRDERWCERVVVAERYGRSVLPRLGGPVSDCRGYSALAAASWPDGVIPDGQTVEIHTAYRRWLGDWLPQLQTGVVLTIDYGDTMPALYRRRPSGSLRAYFQHQRFNDDEIFARFAAQDLTCDVNFGDLVQWGEDLGLRSDALTDQSSFLQRWYPEYRRTAARSPAAAFLGDPDGAGGAFKVLTQHAG